MSLLPSDRRTVVFAAWVSAILVAAAGASGEPWRVVDPEGAGTAGATVTVYRLPVTGSPLERASTRIGTYASGDDGRIDGGLPQLEQLVVAVDHPRFAPRVVTGAPELLRTLRLEPGRPWSEPVRATDGSAVSSGDLCVSFALDATPLGRQLDFERCAAIEDGRFLIAGLPPDTTGRLRIAAPGYLPVTASYPLPEDEPLVLEPGVLLAGRVVGAAAERLRGARVAVVGGGSSESAPDGGFTVPAPRLPAEIHVRARGHRRQALTVEEVDPAEPLVVRLEPGPTLTARILGEDGRAPEGGSARFLRYQADTATWRTASRVGVSAADPPREVAADAHEPSGDGPTTEAAVELDVDLPGEGEYRLTVAAPGYRRHRQPTFAVGPAGHVDLGLIQLRHGAGVTAKVVDAQSGEPVPGVLGQLSPTGTAGVLEIAGDGAAAATSDTEGDLRITGQEAGAFELQLSHRDYATRIVEVELEDGRIHDLGAIWVGSGTAVSGSVVDRAGKPRAGLQVRLVGAAVGSLSTLAERATGTDGRFREVRLGAGDYRVEVHGDDLLLDQALTIGEDEPEVDLELVVGGTRWRGRVYRGRRPVTGGSLLVRPLSETAHQRGRVMVAAPGIEPQLLGGGGGTSSGSVDREGRFELLDAPTGLVLVTYLGADGGRARERLFVPPDAEVRQDVHLTGSSLDGIVLDAETGRPLADALLRLRDPLDTVVAETVSGAGGAFRLSGFDLASSYRLEADLAGYRPRLLADVAVEDGMAPLEILLEPAASSSLEVHLERRDGSRPSRALISLFSEGGWMLRSMMLDPYGEIVFADVAPGRYFLLWHDAATGTGVAAVEVGSDGPTRFSEVLQPGAPLHLDCGEGCAGEPPPALAVVAGSGVEITSHLPAISPALRFSAEGRLHLGHLQPGDYLVRSWLGGRPADHRITARAGEPVTVAVSDPRSRSR